MVRITVICGDITGIDADLYVNSANSILSQGTGAAGQYVDFFGPLTNAVEIEDYEHLISIAKEPLKSPLNYMHYEQKRAPSKFQYECLKEMVERRDSREIPLGDAVLINMITDTGNYPIANAVGMTYDWKQNPPTVILATYETVYNSLAKSLGFAKRLNCKSIAIPVMCTRKGGLSEKVSSEATRSAIEDYGDFLDRVFVVLYNDELEKNTQFFESFYSSKRYGRQSPI